MCTGVIATPSLLKVGELKSICLECQRGGPFELALRVERLGQSEEQRPALLRGQLGLRQQTLDHGQVGRGKLRSQPSCKSSQDAGVTRVVSQGLTERRQRAVEVTKPLENRSETSMRGGQTRLEPDRMSEALLGRVEQSQNIETVAKLISSLG